MTTTAAVLDMSESGPLLKNLAIRDDQLLEIRPLIEEALEVYIWVEAHDHDPYTTVLDKLHKFVSVQSISLLMFDGKKEELVLTAMTSRPKSKLLEERYRVDGNFSGSALKKGEAELYNDIPKEPLAHQKSVNDWSAILRPFPIKHGVFVPIYGELELKCVLRFFNRLLPSGELSPIGFTQQDKQMLSFLAKVVGSQLNKIWLADRLRITSKAISSLYECANIEEVATQIARTGIQLGEAAAAAVFIPDQATQSFLILEGSSGLRPIDDKISLPLNKSLIGSVVQTGLPKEIFDLQSGVATSPLGPGKRDGMGSCLAMPLGPPLDDSKPATHKESKLLPGALVVYSKLKRQFHTSTFNLLQQFALSAGGIIDNHRRAQESTDLRDALAAAGHSVRIPLERLAMGLKEIGGKDANQQFAALLKDAKADLELANARFETMLVSKPGLITVASLNLTTVSVHEIISACVARHSKIAVRKNRSVESRDLRRLPRIRGDAAKLDLVFDNLIENAIKYSWKGEPTVISGEEVGANIRISVTERGLGIPENMRDKIFENFTRSNILDRQRKIMGTGLGLYISKLIVEAHGGSITFKSIPFLNDPERRANYEGYETTFIVSLPIEVLA